MFGPLQLSSVEPPLKRRSKPLIIIGILALVLLIVGATIRSHMSRAEAPPRTVSARTGTLTISVSETGAISSATTVNVKSKVAGRLLSVPVEEGQYVQKGQLIATVDRALIDPQIARAQAQLAEANARLAQATASYDMQRAQTRTSIAQAQAGLTSATAHLATVRAGTRPQEIAQQQEAIVRAQIELDDARRTQARKQALLAKGFISQSEADTAQVAVDTASANIESAQQQLALLRAGARPQEVDEARAQIGSARVQLDAAHAAAAQNEIRRSDILQAQANVQQIENDLQQLMVQLADTRIVAPASGIVLKKYKQVNEIVQSATTSFSDSDSTVCALGGVPMVEVDVNEVDLGKVRIGAPVRVTVDSVPGAVFAATVASIAPVSSSTLQSAGQASASAGTVSKFPVKIHFTRPDNRLRPGMSAVAEIIFAEHKNVVIAPVEGVAFKGKSGYVQVLGNDNMVLTRHITTGLRNDTDVEIVGGLSKGERLVTNPIDGRDRRKLDITTD